MLTRTTLARLAISLTIAFFVAITAFCQQKPTPATPPGVREFPVVLQKGVVAGKTLVGTKVEARLEVATLLAGTVVPKNAVFSGEVIESVAKTKNTPSRLAIRMNSLLWKDGSAPIKAYLTAWYYPVRDEAGQNLQYGPTEPANRTWNGAGQYPDPNSKVYKPFPGGDQDKGTSVPDTPASLLSTNHILMKDVEYASSQDGGITLVSNHFDLKFDKLTVYVLAADDRPPAK